MASVCGDDGDDEDDEEEYSFDDDFSNSAQEEKSELSSICEESGDLNFSKTNIIQSKAAAPPLDFDSDRTDKHQSDQTHAKHFGRELECQPVQVKEDYSKGNLAQCGDSQKRSKGRKHDPSELATEHQHCIEERNRDPRADINGSNAKKAPRNWINSVIKKNAATQSGIHVAQTPSHPQQQRPQSKPSNFVPRCASIKTKCMSIQNVNTQDAEKPAKSVRYSKQHIVELAKPRSHWLYEKENNDPEPSKTRDKPKKKPSFSSANDGIENFLDRMEVMAKRRKEKLERAAAEALYNSKVDKLTCPNCGTPQSYEEFLGGRTQCQSDGCEKYSYQHPKRFILKKFEERMERSCQRRNYVLNQIEEERRHSISNPSFKKSRRQKELLQKVSKDGNDFMSRMERDIDKRKDKIYKLEEMAVEMESKVCTFAPKLNVANHLLRNRKSGIDHLAEPRSSELYQVKSKKKKKQKRRRKPLESPWDERCSGKNSSKIKAGKSKTKNYDEEHMRRSFQKMIM